MNRTTYGLDLAKSVMQLHWIDSETGEIGRKKLTRAKLSEFFATRQSAYIAMEACGSAHHWARTLGSLGHQVELLPAKQALRGGSLPAVEEMHHRREGHRCVVRQHCLQGDRPARRWR